MILRFFTLSNVNCNTIILENSYPHVLVLIRRKFSLEFSMFVRLLFLSKLPARRVYRCFAKESVLLRASSMMVVRNDREMDFSSFELSLKTVKSSRIIRLCHVSASYVRALRPNFWRYPYLPVSSARH